MQKQKQQHHRHLVSPSSSSFSLADIMDLDAASGGGGHTAPGTPTSPRSKHSATEQRRRGIINDRFQILRDLIPHSDHKRDRATFLLEVIEYVKFLQQKLHKYEPSADWRKENAKLMPWSSNRESVDGMPDAPPSAKNGCAPGLEFLGNSIPAAPEMLQNAQTVVESSELNAGCIETYSQSQWQQFPSSSDCPVSNDMGNGHEELAIDEGTITVSSMYSQNLFTALTTTMESSGVDLSQASVTVEVNLGRRAISRRPNHMTSAKDQRDMPDANQIMEDSGKTRSSEGYEQALKRHIV